MMEAARRPVPAVVIALGVAACAAAAITMTIALSSEERGSAAIHGSLMAWITLTYVFAGLVAWTRRPASRFGPLMIVAGFASFASSLSSSTAAALFTIGLVFDLLPAVLFLHIFLAFPSGRLGRGIEQGLVLAGYAVALGGQLFAMVLGGFGPDNLLAVGSDPEAAHNVQRVALALLSAMLLAGVAILAQRRRGSAQPLRRRLAVLIDCFAGGLVMLALLFLCGALGLIEGQFVFEATRRVTLFVLGLAPLAFLAGLLQARLARSAVGDLLLELRAQPSAHELRTALARALRDPSLTLLFWLSDGSWADVDGQPAALPEGGGRAITLIDRAETHVAALVHDPWLTDERELLDAVAAAAAIALENTRLQVELRARLDDLKASRLRIIEAGQSERQRMERNLHDGAQQRLVALSLELGILEARFAGDPEARAQIDQVKRELAGSLEDLRELARGLHPALLTGHGLAAALEGLVARAPVHVGLNVQLETRLPEQHEVAAYYLVSESLTNVAKYAHATHVEVAVSRTAGRLVIEVSDDGCGGADTAGGSGLRGLADRVEALDGRLRVVSPAGGGTRVRAEIPCA
jgi:signal transduction histidine kinase